MLEPLDLTTHEKPPHPLTLIKPHVLVITLPVLAPQNEDTVSSQKLATLAQPVIAPLSSLILN